MAVQVPTFHHSVAILPHDIDHMGHVNNAVYLQWVQEAVLAYWKRESPQHVQSHLLWVALKHEITYRLPLFFGDDVMACVTATSTRGSRASFTTIFRRKDNVAAEVRSSWCCVDAQTRRPRRISSDIAVVFLPKNEDR